MDGRLATCPYAVLLYRRQLLSLSPYFQSSCLSHNSIHLQCDGSYPPLQDVQVSQPATVSWKISSATCWVDESTESSNAVVTWPSIDPVSDSAMYISYLFGSHVASIPFWYGCSFGSTDPSPYCVVLWTFLWGGLGGGWYVTYRLSTARLRPSG